MILYVDRGGPDQTAHSDLDLPVGICPKDIFMLNKTLTNIYKIAKKQQLFHKIS